MTVVSFGQEETLYIKSKNFKLFEDRIDFYDLSEIIRGNFKLISSVFTVTRVAGEERNIIAKQGAYIEFETGKATSVELDYDLKTEIGELRKDVKALINSKDSTETIDVICDFLSINSGSEIYKGKVDSKNKKIKLTKGSLYAESDEFIYSGKADIIELIGNVYIEDPKNKRRIWGDKIIMNLKNDEVEGLNVTMEIIIKK